MKLSISTLFFVLLAGCVSQPQPSPTPSAPPAPPSIKRAAAPPPVPKALVAAAPMAAVAPSTARVTLAWNKSPSADVAGYNIYFGAASRHYTNSVDAGTNLIYTVTVPANVTNYFAATAYTSGLRLESDFSSEAVLAPAQKKTNAVQVTYVEVSTNNLWNSWVPVAVYTNTIPDPPPILFFRARVAIDYVTSP